MTVEERTPERIALYWKTLADCKHDVEAWPDFVKRAFCVPVVASSPEGGKP